MNLKIVLMIQKFIKNNSIYIHHFLIFQFDEFKIRPGVPIKISGLFQTLNLTFLSTRNLKGIAEQSSR